MDAQPMPWAEHAFMMPQHLFNNCTTHVYGVLTLHLGASAPASALMALSALLSSTKLIVAFSSSRPTICRKNTQCCRHEAALDDCQPESV